MLTLTELLIITGVLLVAFIATLAHDYFTQANKIKLTNKAKK